MPQVSAELRWFLNATHAADVRAFGLWFRSGEIPPGGGRQRRDVYALDRSTEEIGIKKREGRSGLEVKALVEPCLISLDFAGRKATAQLWSKTVSNTLALPSDPNDQLAVFKTRWLRKFETATPTATEVRLGGGLSGEDPIEDPRPALGCNVGWTLVEVPGMAAQWWSFGFETFAFGQPGPLFPLLEEALRKTISALGVVMPGRPALGEKWREQSYPAWLKRTSEQPTIEFC